MVKFGVLIFFLLFITTALAADGGKLTVSSRIGMPYLGKNKFDGKFEGYVVDLMDEISSILNFTYEIKPSPDGRYGFYDVNRKAWNGMIGDLINGKADMAVGDITITEERLSAVDFSIPFMSGGIGMLFKRSHPTSNWLTFLEPFELDTWLLIVVSVVILSLLTFAIKRFAAVNEDYKSTSCFDCLYPRSLSTFVLAIVWWIFLIVTISFYIAGLVNVLDNNNAVNDFDEVEDVLDYDMKFGCVKNGATNAFFQDSQIDLIADMYEKMTEWDNNNEGIYVTSTQQGFDKVEKGDYAFIGESTSLEYAMKENCDLVIVGEQLNQYDYGIAVPKSSSWKYFLDNAIIRLKSSGKLLTLKEKWWGSSDEECVKGEISDSNVDLGQMWGFFIFIIVGGVLALVVAVVQYILQKRNSSDKVRTNV